MSPPPPELLLLAVAVACHAAPEAEPWLRRCAELAPDVPLPAAPDAGADDAVDEVLERAWRSRSPEERTALGQVFTPRPVARQVLLELGVDGVGRVLDPACGGGIFLVEAAALRRRALADQSPRQVADALLDGLVGIDVDPIACRLARLLVGLEVVRALGGVAPADLPLPTVIEADATDPAVLASLPAVRWVVGNPPYLEAKRMPSKLREVLRSRFGGRLQGAFDYYVCFLWLALDLAGPHGGVGLVLPNKVQVARYAAGLRAHLLRERRVWALVDLSEVDVFRRVGVYPILLILKASSTTYKACFRVDDLDGLGVAPLVGADLAMALPERWNQPPVWFTLPPGPLPRLLERLAERPRLEAVAEIRSTCSFHRKGLRERYVRCEAELPDGLPYLGGRSYSRRNEVRPYAIEWERFRIDYAADELRALGNGLPPLDIFLRPKIVICQHARSLVAWCDDGGRFVTKDVFPVVLPRDPRPQAAAGWTAVLNSRVASVLYWLLFRGIQIGGGYLHFLPVYLRRLPIPDPDAVPSLASEVLALQAEPDAARADALDARGVGPVRPRRRGDVRHRALRRRGPRVRTGSARAPLTV